MQVFECVLQGPDVFVCLCWCLQVLRLFVCMCVCTTYEGRDVEPRYRGGVLLACVPG